VKDSDQASAYAPLTAKDTMRIRAGSDQNNFDSAFENSTLDSAAKINVGTRGGDFKSAKQLVALAPTLKEHGFSFAQLNIEKGSQFDASEYADLVNNYKKAADACHAAGLQFRAAPMRQDANKYCVELSKFCDYIHVQTQAKQDDGPKAFKAALTDIINKVNSANPDSKVRYTCQVSTQQGSMSGKSLLKTMQVCTDAVAAVDKLDAISAWFGGSGIKTLKNYVAWFKAKYG
jgi:hypothetical protein